MDLKRFSKYVSRSQLVAPDALARGLNYFSWGHRAPGSNGSDGEALGDYFVHLGLLTPWQRQMLLDGFATGFFFRDLKFLGELRNDGVKESYLAEDPSGGRWIVSFGLQADCNAHTIFEWRPLPEVKPVAGSSPPQPPVVPGAAGE